MTNDINRNQGGNPFRAHHSGRAFKLVARDSRVVPHSAHWRADDVRKQKRILRRHGVRVN